MKSSVYIVLTISLLFVSCTSAPSATPTLVADVIPLTPAGATVPANTPTAIATLTNTATPTNTSTPTLLPTNTPLPPLTVSFYRLRIEYSTTSDWTTLDLDKATNILTARLITISGNPSNFEAGVYHLALNQPISAAQAGQSVGVTVDYALFPNSLNQPLAFLLKKGALNGSVVRVLNVTGNNVQLIQEVKHQVVVESNTDFNPLAFSVDLSSLKSTSPLQVQIERPTSQRMLWAFYYPWYYADDWSSTQLKDRPITRYSSDDRRAITHQIEQAQSAGIDGFISSWWGPGSYTDQNLKLLLDIAQEKRFSVTIYFETLKDSSPRDKDEILKWLSYAISTYRGHPAFMKVNGKPLIVIWASESVPLATWKSVLKELRAQGLDATYLAMGYNITNLDVFDGLHEYNVFTIPNLTETFRSVARATRYYGLLADSPTPKIWVATVQPGYDDRLIPGRSGLFQDRDNGKFYRNTFEAALKSDPDWIFITTWNEWWEHTYIEPSELYGDLYLRITREFAEKWKGK
jgi:hypothetical protein